MLVFKERVKYVRHFIEPSHTCQQPNLRQEKKKRSAITQLNLVELQPKDGGFQDVLRKIDY